MCIDSKFKLQRNLRDTKSNISSLLKCHWFSLLFNFYSYTDSFNAPACYTTYGRNMSWLPSAKIIDRRFSLAAACMLSSIDKPLLYSVKFELKLTICRWCWSRFDIVFDWWNPLALLSSKLASRILSAVALWPAMCSLMEPLIGCIGPLVIVSVEVFSVCDVADDGDETDDTVDDDDDDDDFFSLASCWAFFERFHFMRRFWNHILTCIRKIPEENNNNNINK